MYPFTIPRLAPGSMPVAAGAFGPAPGAFGAFGAAPGAFGAFGAAPAAPAPPVGMQPYGGVSSPGVFGPFGPSLVPSEPYRPEGPGTAAAFGTVQPFGTGMAAQHFPSRLPPFQPALQVFGAAPGASVFAAPAGTTTLPSGQVIRESYFKAPISPAFPSRSVEITETGRGNPVHSSIACSSDLAGLAQRVTALLEASPADQVVQQALNLLQNCMLERQANAARHGGMNPGHQKVYDLIDKLGNFIKDYYTNAGATRGGMRVIYMGAVDRGFQIYLQNAVPYAGRMYSRFQAEPSSLYPVAGGRRKVKKTRRAKRKSRKTRARK